MTLDVVTVFHNPTNRIQAYELADQIYKHADSEYTMVFGDNTADNIGFGPRCNLEARHGSAPVIGFINPDAIVEGPFMRRVLGMFGDDDLVITGERYGKPQSEIKAWGLTDWVCGAAFFVRRSWFEQVGGFHDGYKWGWEETDLCRIAEATGKRVRSIPLPIVHASPDEDSPNDVRFKRKEFEAGAKLFKKRWPR